MFPLLSATGLRVNHAFDKFPTTREPISASAQLASNQIQAETPDNLQRSMLQVFILDMNLLDHLGDALSVVGDKEISHVNVLCTDFQKPGAVYNRVKNVLDSFYILSPGEFATTIDLMLSKIDLHFNNRQSILKAFNAWLNMRTNGDRNSTAVTISKLFLVYSADLTQINSYMRSKNLPPISFKRMFEDSNNLAPYIISSSIVASFELLNNRYKQHMMKPNEPALLTPADFQYFPQNALNNSGILPGSDSGNTIINSVLLSRISEHIKAHEDSLLDTEEENTRFPPIKPITQMAEVQTDDFVDQLQGRVQFLLDENARLLKSVDELQSRKMDREAEELIHFKTSLAAARAEVEALKGQLMDSYAEKGEQAAQLEKMHLDTQLHRTDMQQLRENLSLMTKRLEEASLEVSSLRECSMNTNTRLAEERSNCFKQQATIAQLKAQIQEIVETVYPSSDDMLSTTRDSAQHSSDDVEAQLSNLKKAVDEYEMLKKHAAALEMICDEQRKKLQSDDERKNTMINREIETEMEAFLQELDAMDKLRMEVARLTELLVEKDVELKRLRECIEDYNGQLRNIDETNTAKSCLQEMKVLRDRLETDYEDVLTSTKVSMLSSVTEFTSQKSEEIARISEALALKTQMLEATKAKLKEDEQELVNLREEIAMMQKEIAQRDTLIKELLIKASDVEEEQRKTDILSHSFAKQRAILDNEISSRDAIISELSRAQNLPPVWIQAGVADIKNGLLSLLEYIKKCEVEEWMEARAAIAEILTGIMSTTSSIFNQFSSSHVKAAQHPSSNEVDSSVASDIQESAGVVRFQLATDTQMTKTAIHIMGTGKAGDPSSLASTAKSFDDYVEVSEDNGVRSSSSGM